MPAGSQSLSPVCYGSNLGAGQALRPLPRSGAAAGRERVGAGRAEWRAVSPSARAPAPPPPAVAARRGGERGGPASGFATSRGSPHKVRTRALSFPQNPKVLGRALSWVSVPVPPARPVRPARSSHPADPRFATQSWGLSSPEVCSRVPAGCLRRCLGRKRVRTRSRALRGPRQVGTRRDPRGSWPGRGRGRGPGPGSTSRWGRGPSVFSGTQGPATSAPFHVL